MEMKNVKKEPVENQECDNREGKDVRGNNSGSDEAEDEVNDSEDKVAKNTRSEQPQEKGIQKK